MMFSMYIMQEIPEYSLKYWYDDWSTYGMVTWLRHRLGFHATGCHDDTYIDLQASCYDIWVSSMLEWCHQNIGDHGTDWAFSRPQGQFYFKTLEDTIAFKLRW